MAVSPGSFDGYAPQNTRKQLPVSIYHLIATKSVAEFPSYYRKSDIMGRGWVINSFQIHWH